ncbi:MULTISPECIES: hypothetical protein [Actinosynnema]|uniref:hypothetical protein n=1 Tax=Actinosynnema TaxID=40566 RepID=UPI0020A54EEF|nr:hypothetical protein [Actinosynnema pretiosum]MCP2095576.1 hypothetical protein [Actinosynnema pretiosum]
MDSSASSGGTGCASRAGAEFAELVREVVVDDMPRLFAVVYEQVPRQGVEVAAYGMAFLGRAELVSPDGADRMTSASAHQAAALLAASTGVGGVKAHLVWLDALVESS